MYAPLTFFNCESCNHQTFGIKRHDSIECVTCKHVRMLPAARQTAEKIASVIKWQNTKEDSSKQKED